MSKSIISAFFLLVMVSMVHAGSVDVLIKGVDDGVKTNKQQDHKEAVMNAKLQAIERAGVEVSSITRIENFQMKFDKVESQASGVLEPGFNVIDLGYQVDGTYQVVLSGKVNSGKGASSLGEVVKVGKFRLYEDAGVVVDEAKGLMWMREDKNLITGDYAHTYNEVLAFVELVNQKRYAGFDDWRVPGYYEVRSIFDRDGYVVHRDYPLFHEEPYGKYWTNETSSKSSDWYVLTSSATLYGHKSIPAIWGEVPGSYWDPSKPSHVNEAEGAARLVRDISKKNYFKQ